MQKGEAPASIERFFEIENFGKVDWRHELREALEAYFRDDFVMMPPSKKLLYQGIYLPSSISKTFRLAIAIDSSGSVDEVLLGEFLSEINFLMQQVQNYIIDILVCDDTIHSHATFLSGEVLDVKLKGGGGTDFRPVFEFIEKELDDLKMLLYFTDLEGVFPKETPSYEVRWVTPKKGAVPFGSEILLS